MKGMKKTGIEWIGDIPSAWNISNIGGMYTLRNEKVSDKDYLPLSVTKQGVLPQLENVAKTDAHDDRKLVRVGDFAINSRSDRRGSCGISAYEGSVSLINTVLCPRIEINPRYYNWLFHTAEFANEFYKQGHGIVDDLWTTRWQDMKRIQVPQPSLEEQEIIANFLDTKCSEIDALMADIQTQIETLEQYKRSVITEAVTKGLNPNVEMKPSGIEWIGEIPVHWDVLRFKYAVTALVKGNGITKEDIVVDGDSPCLRYGEIYTKYEQSFNECVTRTNKQKISAPRYFSYGDILFVGTGELIEEIGKSIVYLGYEECLAGGDIIIAKHKQNPSFLNYAVNSHCANAQKGCGKMKLKVVHISALDIGNVVIALPPFEEQLEIASYLDSICFEADNCIAAKKAQLEILASYKKSLIYEYVTGKKEAPHAVV